MCSTLTPCLSLYGVPKQSVWLPFRNGSPLPPQSHHLLALFVHCKLDPLIQSIPTAFQLVWISFAALYPNLWTTAAPNLHPTVPLKWGGWMWVKRKGDLGAYPGKIFVAKMAHGSCAVRSLLAYHSMEFPSNPLGCLSGMEAHFHPRVTTCWRFLCIANWIL